MLVLYYFLNLRVFHKAFKVIILMLAVFCLTVSPWIFRNALVHKAFVPSTSGGLNFWLANNLSVPERYKTGDWLAGTMQFEPEINSLSEIEKSGYFLKKGLDFAKQYPIKFVKYKLYTLVEMLHLWPMDRGGETDIGVTGFKAGYWVKRAYSVYYLGLLGCALISTVLSCNDINVFHRIVLLALLFFAYTVLHMFFIPAGGIRYRVPLDVLVIVIASFAIYHIYARMKIIIT